MSLRFPSSQKRTVAFDIAILITALLLTVVRCPSTAQEIAVPVTLNQFQALDQPEPLLQIRYGEHTVQGVDVFFPTSSGPHPVVVLLHGGCWRALPGADRTQLRALALEISKRGWAVWNLGYRRSDEAGGGFPGTYDDVSAGLDLLRSHATALDLDLSRLTFVGHSAGGHLALWAAARTSLRAESELYRPDPISPTHVVSLSGIADLDAFAVHMTNICGPGVLDAISPMPIRADTSPARLGLPTVPTMMIAGLKDAVVPPRYARELVHAFGREYGDLKYVPLEDAGHFDLVHPGTHAGRRVVEMITSQR